MLISAFIWGTTFVAQTTGMETIGPMTFTSIRYLIGTLTVSFSFDMDFNCLYHININICTPY